MSYESMSPADYAAVNGNNRNGMFGGDGSWWLIILFLFAICGFGGNGWGGVGGGGGAMSGYVLTSDFATIERKLDGINNGICDATFALNNTMTTGFSTAELSRANQQAALMQMLYTMSAENKQCCCETQRMVERGFAETNYNLATQLCEVKTLMQSNTRDIIDNQNCNTRAVLDFLTQEKLSALREENQALKLTASQQAQNAYLLHELKPTPSAAYIVPNPNCCYQYSVQPAGACCGGGTSF